MASPPMSPSTVEQVVAAIFAEVPRVVTWRDQNKPQRSAAETMPDEVCKSLRGLELIDDGDIFLDSGSGAGNIVAHAVIATNVYRAIEIKLREDIIGRQFYSNK
ncbi:unnamed protein product [Phytophthora fragariaefolia]|uniref:Unnamed protein product n=1 Tax=Phytophthora fragariaefolia TaxID=1490495 RepID=A0A9W6YGI5_9STRA|nr:unnamed protein product [Phytophthora fragariaefolia]